MTHHPKTPYCSTMAEVRQQIDVLDDVLVPLLVQRASYMLQAARIKPLRQQVRDPARIEAIVTRVRQQALAEGGDADVIEAIYRGMMEACIAYEHREFERLCAAGLKDATDAASAKAETQGAARRSVGAV